MSLAGRTFILVANPSSDGFVNFVGPSNFIQTGRSISGRDTWDGMYLMQNKLWYVYNGSQMQEMYNFGTSEWTIPYTSARTITFSDDIYQAYATAEEWILANSEEVLPTYDITTVVSPVGSGTLVSDKNTAEEGETVTLTATPGSDYVFTEYQTSPSVTITNNQFTMPSSNVTITAVFTAIPVNQVRRLKIKDPSDNRYLIEGLPAVTSSDNSKILKVSEGAWAAGEAPGGLPTAPSSDGEYYLKCTISSGTPTYSWVTIPAANGVSF